MGRPLEIKVAVYYGKSVEGAYAMFKRDPSNLKPEPQPSDVPAPYICICSIRSSRSMPLVQSPLEPAQGL